MNHEAQQPENAMWYYLRNNQQTGPVDSAEIERLKGSGDVTRSTKVWRDGMAEWQPAMSTELRRMFSKNVPPPVSPPAIAVPTKRADDVKRLNTWFMSYWICLAAGIPLSIIIIGLGGIIAAAIFWCFILHRLWSLVPPAEAETTPGKAVGFQFIPFFNFYWGFVAVYGLAKALNAQTKRASIPDKEVNEGLALTLCILQCCTLIPYVNILVLIALIPISIISFKQLKDAGIALIETENA